VAARLARSQLASKPAPIIRAQVAQEGREIEAGDAVELVLEQAADHCGRGETGAEADKDEEGPLFDKHPHHERPRGP
jgi:hypothetical protein